MIAVLGPHLRACRSARPGGGNITENTGPITGSCSQSRPRTWRRRGRRGARRRRRRERGPTNYSGAITTAYRAHSGRYVFAGRRRPELPSRVGHRGAGPHGRLGAGGRHERPAQPGDVTAGLHATHCLVDRRFTSMTSAASSTRARLVPVRRVRPPVHRHRFIGTAKMRARFRPCFDSVVEHLNAWSPKGEVGATARKTMRAIDTDSGSTTPGGTCGS